MNAGFDPDALRAMVLGVDLGSFASAAAHLGRSQSAISMQIKKLEQQVGTPLFVRNGRSLAPTDAGERLLEFGRKIVALNDEAAAALRAPAALQTVRIGLPQDFFEDVFPQALALFRLVYPKVHVDVRAGRNFALEGDVSSGKLDFAFAFFESGAPKRGQRLSTYPLYWLGASPSLRKDGPLPLILYDQPCLFRTAALRALDTHRISWRPALTTSSLQGVWAALSSGYGITVRTGRRLPANVRDVRSEFALPALPDIEARLLTGDTLSAAARELMQIICHTIVETQDEISTNAHKRGARELDRDVASVSNAR